MGYQPGSSYYGAFTLSNAGGAPTAADDLPVATARRNGADDLDVELTVTTAAPGDYSLAGTIPEDYLAGDTVHIVVSAAVDGLAGLAVVDRFVLDPLGSGPIPFTYTVFEEDEVTPVSGASVYVTESEDGTGARSRTLITDALGRVVFMLNAGLAYFWVYRAGSSPPTEPDTETVG